ncbi:MAG: hypothetical protein SPL35_07315 [Bacteroidales bacterium]|nr:hypothetical protein [Bacteroidales bacterium]
MKKFILSLLAVLVAVPVFACTSVIVSGKKSASGRPVMYKHRDTGTLDNYIGRYKGELYTFIGLVNTKSGGGEVWTGTNSAGFSIMNTATYDLKDDDVPEDQMDREGILMYKALGTCKTLADFENLLNTHPRPMGVEANFGVIDAFGGAAYYEVNNHSWVKFDVNDDSVAPLGYLVVTNFTQTGRPEDRKGVDRYEKAKKIMAGLQDNPDKALFCDHKFLINNFSRKGGPILRNITSSTIAIEGVRAGDNPLKTVMWTACGYPTAAICVPLMVLDDDFIPSYLSPDADEHCVMCDNALKIKEKSLDARKACRKTEKYINKKFTSLYRRWVAGEMSFEKFKADYKVLLDKIYNKYEENFAKYLM